MVEGRAWGAEHCASPRRPEGSVTGTVSAEVEAGERMGVETPGGGAYGSQARSH